jgi:integrase
MNNQTTMVSLAEEYLASRRRLGFALRIEGAELLRFARYADRTGHEGPLSTELALEWARLPNNCERLYWARRLDTVRRFARYRILFDPATEIPPQGLLGPSYRRRPEPYIYSEAETRMLLCAAGRLGPPGGLRPKTYVTLFGLLASTGLRVSEALRLTRADADLNAGVLRISETKFKKSRLVPLHPSATQALRDYAHQRDRYHPFPKAPAFFLTQHGTALKYWRAFMTFCTLRRSLSWTEGRGKRRPTLQGFRHTFAVRCLLHWYQEGANVEHKIAALSTYLGHTKVSDTYWYLTAVPELLALAAARFERWSESNPGGQP